MEKQEEGHHNCPKCLGSKELIKVDDITNEETLEMCYYCKGEGWVFYQDSDIDDFSDFDDSDFLLTDADDIDDIEGDVNEY